MFDISLYIVFVLWTYGIEQTSSIILVSFIFQVRVSSVEGLKISLSKESRGEFPISPRKPTRKKETAIYIPRKLPQSMILRKVSQEILWSIERYDGIVVCPYPNSDPILKEVRV